MECINIPLTLMQNNENAAEHVSQLPRTRKRSSIRVSRKKSGQAMHPLSTLLNAQYKAAIRFILRVKYWKCIKSFKNIRYPFVNVQDIMEKNAICHTETLSHLKDIQDNLTEFRIELQEMRNCMNKLLPQASILNRPSVTFSDEDQILNDSVEVLEEVFNENEPVLFISD